MAKVSSGTVVSSLKRNGLWHRREAGGRKMSQTGIKKQFPSQYGGAYRETKKLKRLRLQLIRVVPRPSGLRAGENKGPKSDPPPVVPN